MQQKYHALHLNDTLQDQNLFHPSTLHRQLPSKINCATLVATFASYKRWVIVCEHNRFPANLCLIKTTERY